MQKTKKQTESDGKDEEDLDLGGGGANEMVKEEDPLVQEVADETAKEDEPAYRGAAAAA